MGVVFRRFEVKFSTWPYSLFLMVHEDVPLQQWTDVASALLSADRRELDIYSAGARRLCGTPEALLGPLCRMTVNTDMDSFALTTDKIERLNSQVTQAVSFRGPSAKFVYMARENIVRQAMTHHRQRGGQGPLDRRGAHQASVQEEVRTMPLLREAVCGAGDRGPGAGDAANHQGPQAMGAGHGAPAGRPDGDPTHRLHADDGFSLDPVTVVRDCSDDLLGHELPSPSEQPQRRR